MSDQRFARPDDGKACDGASEPRRRGQHWDTRLIRSHPGSRLRTSDTNRNVTATLSRGACRRVGMESRSTVSPKCPMSSPMHASRKMPCLGAGDGDAATVWTSAPRQAEEGRGGSPSRGSVPQGHRGVRAASKRATHSARIELQDLCLQYPTVTDMLVPRFRSGRRRRTTRRSMRSPTRRVRLRNAMHKWWRVNGRRGERSCH